MKKAVLYARVSSDAQQKERTVESQVAMLKKQIVERGDVLIKEYVDDGYSGASMERPALDQLRGEVKEDLFDTVYFLNTDRIARDVAFQNLIIAEILKHKKQIIINGKDYVHNPENKFQLTVLGAVAELERAKIIERSQRGKLHRLRQGIPLNNGYNTYGYTYIPRSEHTPARYEIHEQEAKTVRYVFKAYAKENASWSTMVRYLEERKIPTKTGKYVWDTEKLRSILKNHSYVGIKYFNTCTLVKEPGSPLRGIKYGKKVYKDKSEWIGIAIPAIVSKEVFALAQKRLQKSRNTYRNPKETQLLSNLVTCGSCGKSVNAYQRYIRGYCRGKPTGKIYHRVAYRCSQRIQQRMHAKHSKVVRCSNPEMSARRLESYVFEIIETTLTKPKKLESCLTYSKEKIQATQQTVEKQLKEMDDTIQRLGVQKKRLLNQYAKGSFDRDTYGIKGIEVDNEINKTKLRREELLKKIPVLHKRKVIESSVKHYCELVKTQLSHCTDFDTKRKLLLDYVEEVMLHKDSIELRGSVPMRLEAYADPDQTSDVSKISFNILKESL